MKKRNIRVVVGLAGAAALIMCGLVLRPPLRCYIQFSWGRRVLPTRLIRPAVRLATGHDAPATMEDARGIIQGGREPVFFIGFRTDDDGLRHVLQEFGGFGVKAEVLDEEKLRSGWNAFVGVLSWQKELGVQIYDQDSIHSGRLLSVRFPSADDPSYTIVIDDQRRHVYILAVPWR